MISSIADSFPGPILGLGDFDSVMSQSEKIGGKPLTSSLHPTGLSLSMNQFGLGDDGSKFTWTNNRFGRSHIRERLDRWIANSEWTLLFSNTKILHLPIHTSDHAPLLLSTSATRKAPRSLSLKNSGFECH